MIIKYQALHAHLSRHSSAVYILFGQEPYLLNEAALQIKKSFTSSDDRDDKIIDINTSSDWLSVRDEANHYALFSNQTLIDVRYDKKTIDSTGQKIIKTYLDNPNERCRIVIRAPQLTNKSLTSLAQHPKLTVVPIYPLSEKALVSWIAQELQQRHITYDPQVPTYIHQYMRHNMLACAQCIEKIAITYTPGTKISLYDVSEHVFDQCEYSLYEFVDAFLLGDTVKTIHFLRSNQSKQEAPLILWLLTQEIRHLLNPKKIRPDRQLLYQKAAKRYPNASELHKKLLRCQEIDELIKSGQQNRAWQTLERLVVDLP